MKEFNIQIEATREKDITITPSIDLRPIEIGMTIPGPAGPPGPEGKGLRYEDLTEEEIANIKGVPGDPGPKGDKGDPGEPGPKGDKGDPGERGPKGDKGEPGADGYIPVKGIDYFDGEQGLKGDKGDTGEQGIQGIPGERGIDGAQGIQGIPGKDGVPGERGPQGDPGITAEEKAIWYNKLDRENDTLLTYTEKFIMSAGIIDLNLSNTFVSNINTDTTFSIVNVKDTVAHSFTLVINMGATAKVLTFPANIKWPEGELPDLTTENKTYVLSFLTVDNGATWFGMFGGMF